MQKKIEKILIFGDGFGIEQFIKCIPNDWSIRVKKVAASIRDEPKTVIVDYIQPIKTSNRYKRFVQDIIDFNPDLILVNSYSMYIPQDILDIPTHGAINVHYSLLPRYRGANPIQWAIINGEINVGVTMHYMINKIDAGDIIAQIPVPVYDYESWVSVIGRCAIAAGHLIERELPKILNGTNSRTPQDESRATYYPRRTPTDGEIIWAMPTIDIYNKIRALVKPHPGAFYTDRRGNVIVIDEMKPYSWVENMKLIRGFNL